jgi:hypothetical protein
LFILSGWLYHRYKGKYHDVSLKESELDSRPLNTNQEINGRNNPSSTATFLNQPNNGVIAIMVPSGTVATNDQYDQNTLNYNYQPAQSNALQTSNAPYSDESYKPNVNNLGHVDRVSEQPKVFGESSMPIIVNVGERNAVGKVIEKEKKNVVYIGGF